MSRCQDSALSGQIELHDDHEHQGSPKVVTLPAQLASISFPRPSTLCRLFEAIASMSII